MKTYIFTIILLTLLCSCYNNSNSKKIQEEDNTLNLDLIKEPCDCVKPVIDLTSQMYDLVEENNWKTLNGNSKYSKDYIKINNMLDEIQLKCESILKDNKYKGFNYNECEEFKRWEKNFKDKATKLFNWQQNTTNSY